VVCINRFYMIRTRSGRVKKAAEAAGARCAESEHWLKGGEGALELQTLSSTPANNQNDFKYLYPLEMKLRDRVANCREVYGGMVFLVA